VEKFKLLLKLRVEVFLHELRISKSDIFGGCNTIPAMLLMEEFLPMRFEYVVDKFLTAWK